MLIEMIALIKLKRTDVEITEWWKLKIIFTENNFELSKQLLNGCYVKSK